MGKKKIFFMVLGLSFFLSVFFTGAQGSEKQAKSGKPAGKTSAKPNPYDYSAAGSASNAQSGAVGGVRSQ